MVYALYWMVSPAFEDAKFAVCDTLTVPVRPEDIVSPGSGITTFSQNPTDSELKRVGETARKAALAWLKDCLGSDIPQFDLSVHWTLDRFFKRPDCAQVTVDVLGLPLAVGILVELLDVQDPLGKLAFVGAIQENGTIPHLSCTHELPEIAKNEHLKRVLANASLEEGTLTRTLKEAMENIGVTPSPEKIEGLRTAVQETLGRSRTPDEEILETARKRFFYLGQWAEGADFVRSRMEAFTSTKGRGEAMLLVGNAFSRMGWSQEAEKKFRHVIEQAECSSVVSLKEQALLEWGYHLLESLRDRHGAEEKFQEAEKLVEKAVYGIPMVEGPLWYHRGRVAYYNGKFEQALRLQEDAYTRLREGTDVLWKANVSNSAGKVFSDLYDFPMALELFSESLKIRKSVGADWSLARTYGSAAEALLKLGLSSKAIEYFTQDLETLRKTDDPEVSRVRNYLGNAYLSNGDISQATSLYQNSLSEYETQLGAASDDRERKIQKDLSFTYKGLAKINRALKNWDDLLETLEKAFGIPEDRMDSNALGHLLMMRGVTKREQGDPSGAVEDLKHSAYVFKDDRYFVEAGMAYLELALAYLGQNNSSEANTALNWAEGQMTSFQSKFVEASERYFMEFRQRIGTADSLICRQFPEALDRLNGRFGSSGQFFADVLSKLDGALREGSITEKERKIHQIITSIPVI